MPTLEQSGLTIMAESGSALVVTAPKDIDEGESYSPVSHSKHKNKGHKNHSSGGRKKIIPAAIGMVARVATKVVADHRWTTATCSLSTGTGCS